MLLIYMDIEHIKFFSSSERFTENWLLWYYVPKFLEFHNRYIHVRVLINAYLHSYIEKPESDFRLHKDIFRLLEFRALIRVF